MFKIKNYIPDFITSLNLACGTVGIAMTAIGRIDLAFPLMLAGAVFDFCDGLAARALHAYSDLGKELDSLSDMVSFGLLPAMMMHQVMKTCTFSSSWLCYLPLLIAVFSGIRLAKFNVDTRQTDGFLGLPTPACALVCASLCYYIAHSPASFLAQWAGGYIFFPVLSIVLSILLVCELPMFSMKLHKGDSPALKTKRISLVALAVVISIIVLVSGQNWSLAVLLIFVIYILKNLIYWVFKV